MVGAPESARRNSDGAPSFSTERKIAAVRLIRLVQKHPVLYDRKDVFYRNKRKTEEAWNEIATTLGENGKTWKIFIYKYYVFYTSRFINEMFEKFQT